MNIVNDLPDTSFFEEIERLCRHDKIDYIDAIVEYCERNELDVEAIGRAIVKNPLIFSKITEEAEEYHYIPRTNRLPL